MEGHSPQPRPASPLPPGDRRPGVQGRQRGVALEREAAFQGKKGRGWGSSKDQRPPGLGSYLPAHRDPSALPACFPSLLTPTAGALSLSQFGAETAAGQEPRPQARHGPSAPAHRSMSHDRSRPGRAARRAAASPRRLPGKHTTALPRCLNNGDAHDSCERISFSFKIQIGKNSASYQTTGLNFFRKKKKTQKWHLPGISCVLVTRKISYLEFTRSLKKIKFISVFFSFLFFFFSLVIFHSQKKFYILSSKHLFC